MIETRTILPGVVLTAYHTEKFKTGYFSLNLLRPLCREEAAKNALLPQVLLRGTTAHPDLQSLSVAMNELYGAEIGSCLHKKGEIQTVGLYADYIEDAIVDGEPVFASAAALVAELLLSPATENGVFREDYTKREQEVLRDTIAAGINQKRSYANQQLVKAMFAGEPFSVSRLGEQEDVDALDAAVLYAHYEKVLRTSRVEICYVGRQPIETVEATFRRVLRELPRGELTWVGTTPHTPPTQVRQVTQSLDVTQGKLCMGYYTDITCTDPRWHAMAVLNTVLGGGVTSKLFTNVREKQSLCYYAGSVAERFKGCLLIASGIAFEKKDIACREIEKQLEACRRGEITAEELDSAKKQWVSGLQAVTDSPSHIETYYLNQRLAGTAETPEGEIGKICAVTAADAAAAARTIVPDTVYFLKGADQ